MILFLSISFTPLYSQISVGVRNGSLGWRPRITFIPSEKVFPLMHAMENSSRYNRAPQLLSSLKQRESGYEPSDTESEWPESPWQDLNNDNHRRPGAVVSDRPKTSDSVRCISPLSHSQRQLMKLKMSGASTTRRTS